LNEEKIYRILTINPGSTSTKIGVFDNERCILEHVVRHPRQELSSCPGPGVFSQKELRKQLVLEALKEHTIPLESIDAVSGRAGRLPPMESGTYEINQDLMDSIPDPLPSPALLGMVIAKELADEYHIPGFIVDPATVDELWEVARITGFPEITKVIHVHCLNQKAVARRAAAEMGKRYEDCRFVVAHLGGGISVGAHRYGRIVDGVGGSSGEEPFSPERAGAVPGVLFLELCFSGKYTRDELMERFVRNGGMFSYLGTSDLRETEAMIDHGDKKAELIFEAMTYNVAKAIGQMYAVLDSKADAIILTGGLTYSEHFRTKVTERIRNMGKVIIYPGEFELLALAQGALRVLKNEENPKIFTKK
jgi:butyrate kinase